MNTLNNLLSSRKENRHERRLMLFGKEHPGNNRKNTHGRYHQTIPIKKNGISTGKTKLIRHNATHASGL